VLSGSGRQICLSTVKPSVSDIHVADDTMFFEDLANAANGMFSNFWLVVIVLLPFILALGWIIQWFEG
jgi:hypothetical protein